MRFFGDKLLIFIFICLFFGGELYARGWILFLDGTSSAGKTSFAYELVNELNKKYPKMSFTYESRDAFLSRDEKSESQESESKKSKSKSIEISEESDEEEAAEDDAASDDEYDDGPIIDYLEYLDDLVKKDKNVVADLVMRDDQDIKECLEVLKRDKIIHILVYCPLGEIVERVEKRNRSGNKDDERSLHQAVDQFPDMFLLSNKPSSKDLDAITKKELERIFKKLKKELNDENRQNKAKGKHQKNISEIIRSMKKRYRLHGRHHKAYIQEKFIHDVVVINSEKIPFSVNVKKVEVVFKARQEAQQKLLLPGSCCVNSGVVNYLQHNQIHCPVY